MLGYQDHFQITIKIAATTVLLMGIFGGLGYYIDKKIETYPILFIAGLVISFPIIQIVIYKMTRALIKDTSNGAKAKLALSKKNVSKGNTTSKNN